MQQLRKLGENSGNNDGDKFRHLVFKDKLGVNVQYEDRFLKLELEGRVIAVFHGDYPEIIDALVICGKYDAVFHGHTHQQVNEMVGNTLSLNPGSFMDKSSDAVKGALASRFMRPRPIVHCI